MAAWLTTTAVIAWAQQQGSIATDDAALQACTDAAAEWVEDARSDLPWADWTEPAQVPARIRVGSMMLAWRWFQRKDSPLGVTGYQEFGTQQLLRHDPDIARLLGLGSDGSFIFGAAGRRRDSLTTGEGA